MRSLKMYFECGQLTEVLFQENANTEPRRTIRGKTGGAFRYAGSFQWTSAVKALSLLITKTAMNPQGSTIQGLGGSLAASLDYALSKQPVWLAEMFGCDQQGISFARRMVLRTNPERKRPGPVVLGVNHVYMPTASVEVYVDGQLCSGAQLLPLVASLSDTPIPVEFAAAATGETTEMRLVSNQ